MLFNADSGRRCGLAEGKIFRQPCSFRFFRQPRMLFSFTILVKITFFVFRPDPLLQHGLGECELGPLNPSDETVNSPAEKLPFARETN